MNTECMRFIESLKSRVVAVNSGLFLQFIRDEGWIVIPGIVSASPAKSRGLSLEEINNVCK